ncbi:hypothetical protein M514_09925 [Trichuris suis]|uniref:SUMO-activating enzyme subunit n=1 Tax=Trichuris suis TaxID=68888 RepID=A0A085N4C5_9BILA|nr:hypothetical protein M514_09925 [Trichuris suis]
MAANSQCERLPEEVATSKIFVVGAGGIGCEILKDLLVAGFRDISVIDLDTIECSNLNRQFLFRTEHVGMSKAKVAATSALRYAPCFPPRKVEIKPFHASIMDPTFDVDFIKQFRLVISALDNADARSHVNRLCLATNTPMIDCGTRGRIGQVTVILKAKTECYDCLPRPAEQHYASCTIRNTPSQPMHCIVWAKFLFNQLFGLADDSEDVSPEEADATTTTAAAADSSQLFGLADDSEDVSPEEADATTTTAAAADSRLAASLAFHSNFPTGHELSKQMTDSANAADLKMQQWSSKLRQTFRKYATIANYDPKRILERLFVNDIQYLHGLENCWINRLRPDVIDIASLLDQLETGRKKSSAVARNLVFSIFFFSDQLATRWADWLDREEKPWNLLQCIAVAVDSLKNLKKRLDALGDDACLTWDKVRQHCTPHLLFVTSSNPKDDDVAVDFITAFTNLRSHAFHLPILSRFEISSLAGKIVPAVATANAVIAGLATMKAIELLKGEKIEISAVYLGMSSCGATLNGQLVCPPNEKCLACSPFPRAFLKVNLSTFTIYELEQKVLLKEMKMRSPDVYFVSPSGASQILSSEPGELDGLLGIELGQLSKDNFPAEMKEKTLKQCGIGHGSRITCKDFDLDYSAELLVLNSEDMDSSDYLLERYDKVVENEEEPPAKKGRMEEVKLQCSELILSILDNNGGFRLM